MRKKILASLLAFTTCASMALCSVAYAEESKAAEDKSASESDTKKDTDDKKKKKSNPNISAEYAESPLFDTSKVHTINIICDEAEWANMIQTAEEKPYITCDVEIDGELVKNCAIRPKGNASLRAVAKRHDNKTDRFSFKIEFDHNDNETTYHGLDKLALNSMGQDHTAMKDFLAYTMMRDMGVYAPLCSYTMIQRNGEDFAMYLAVEAVEDGFKVRNYGDADIDIYKPDSTGKIDRQAQTQSNLSTLLRIMNGSYYADKTENDRVDILNDFWGGKNGTVGFNEEFNTVADMRWAGDDAAAYEDIWEESVFKCTDEDKQRFISSLNTLNNGGDIKTKQSAADVDQLMRYFVIHTFTNNNDSQVGIQHHNFYVSDNGGMLAYVPWDYNLSFGAMEFRNSIPDMIGSDLCLDMTPARLDNIMPVDKDLINFPIDTPMYTGENSQLPLLSVWLDTEEGKAEYHKLYDEFITKVEKGDYEKLIDDTYKMITPYIEKDAIFYDKATVDKGVENLKLYYKYRAEAIRGQLDGTIPSTKEGQAAKPETLIDPEGLCTRDMADSDGTAGCPPPMILNPIIKAFLGDDPDYTAGHFSDIVLAYFMDNTSAYDRVPELMQVNQTRGVACSIVAQKYGVDGLFFRDPSTRGGPPTGAGGPPAGVDGAGGPPAGVDGAGGPPAGADGKEA